MRISIPVIDGLLFINVTDISRCEGDNNYTHLHLSCGKRLTVCKTLKVFEHLLPSNLFSRVHQSHLVNVAYIVKYAPGAGGSLTLRGNTHIPVSRTRKSGLLALLTSGWSKSA